jgi:outer membrane receptor protein involved in Fe transport
VQRVEALRGPQGSLYGKNTIGGAVNVVSKKPDLDTIRGEGAFTYGRFNEVTAKGYVTAPLVTDKLALSLAGVYDKRDGIVTDPATGKKYNDRDNLSGRAILRAKPSDRVEVLISGDYTASATRSRWGRPRPTLSASTTIPPSPASRRSSSPRRRRAATTIRHRPASRTAKASGSITGVFRARSTSI